MTNTAKFQAELTKISVVPKLAENKFTFIEPVTFIMLVLCHASLGLCHVIIVLCYVTAS